MKKNNRAFALGRGWWVVPVVVMMAQLLLYFGLQATTGFDGDSAADWWLFVSLLVTLPTLAAILVSPGSRWPHWCVASVCVCWCTMVFWIEGGSVRPWLVSTLVVCSFQSAVFRWTATPPWRIRPSKSRRRKVSIRWLLVYTAIVAALIALARLSGDSEDLIWIAICCVQALIFAILANFLVTLDSSRIRWGILLCVLVTGGILHSAAQRDWIPADAILEVFVGPYYSSEYAEKILFVAPSASLVTVTWMQLALKRFSKGRQRKWPSKQPANATPSG